MATLHDFFVAEVGVHLRRLEEALEGGDATALEQLHRAARALRGTAQVTRENAAFRGASVLEAATRALLDGSLPLDARNTDRLRATAEDLRATARGAQAEARADAIVARWAEAGIDARARIRTATIAQETRAFLEFAAREVVDIADELDRSVHALGEAPMDRASLKSVLRRQRALLGSARLDDIPVLAETLRAVEDLSSVIAKLDVAVRHEWLDVFRCAREVLKSAAPLLQTGRQPEPTNALSRLRVLREELLERHGTGEAVSTVPGAVGLAQPESRPAGEAALEHRAPEHAQEASPPAPAIEEHAPVGTPETSAYRTEPDDPLSWPAPEPTAPEPSAAATPNVQLPSEPQPDATESAVPPEGIDVRELQYRGDRALQRAAELRPVLERMLADTRGGREALAELYDLLKLARE